MITADPYVIGIRPDGTRAGETLATCQDGFVRIVKAEEATEETR